MTSSDLPAIRIERQATQNAFVPSLGIFRNQGLRNGSESQLSLNFDRFGLECLSEVAVQIDPDFGTKDGD